MNNPCFDQKTKTDCSRRCAGCAATCPDWAAYTQQRNEGYDQRKVAKGIRDTCNAVRYERIMKIARHRHKRKH